MREKTTDSRASVTVESIGHTSVQDKRYRMFFNNFGLARKWVGKILKRYEANDNRIRLIAWRGWEHGPDGREILGRYESKTSC